jgi:hypothetical protein
MGRSEGKDKIPGGHDGGCRGETGDALGSTGDSRNGGDRLGAPFHEEEQDRERERLLLWWSRKGMKEEDQVERVI